MDLVLAMSPTAKCFLVLFFTAVAAPLAGFLFRRVSGGWEAIGKGPLAIEPHTPSPEEMEMPDADDPELRREIRQLAVAHNERRSREGLGPLDVEAETERRLADLVGSR